MTRNFLEILSTYESQLKDEISSFEKGLLYTPLKTDDVKEIAENEQQELDHDVGMKLDSPSPHKELKILFMNEDKPSSDVNGDGDGEAYVQGEGQADGQGEPQI